MSPEQVRGQPCTSRSDIWAFGCVLFELLSGRRPFGGDTVSDTLARVLEREPDWKALPASTPRRIVSLLRQCLQKDPAQRPATLGAARRTIAEALRPGWRPTRRLVLAAAAVGAVLLLAFAGTACWQSRPRLCVAGDPPLRERERGPRNSTTSPRVSAKPDHESCPGSPG